MFIEKTFAVIETQDQGQRIDNYLFCKMKGVPKSRIYRAVRRGEVRVNKGRIRPEYRLQCGDIVRLPPLVVKKIVTPLVPKKWLDCLAASIAYEDNGLIVISKMAGWAVHGGSGIQFGIIEALRGQRPEENYLELVHRLDRETSGCLLVAKSREILLFLHNLFTNRLVNKQYLLLVKGHWPRDLCRVKAPIYKWHQPNGERVMKITPEGKMAMTKFRPMRYYKHTTLVEAYPVTGRTHQIRVHAAHVGHPIAGDDKYGDNAFNKNMRTFGLKRLFLHAASIAFKGGQHPMADFAICAPLEQSLQQVLFQQLSRK